MDCHKFITDIHVPQRMNHNDIDDLLNSHLSPPADQSFHMPSEIFQLLVYELSQTFGTDIQSQTIT